MEVDALFFFRLRRLYVADESAQGSELILFEEVSYFCIIAAGNSHIFCPDVKIDVCFYCYKFMTELDVVSGILEGFPLFGSEFSDMLIDIRYSAIFPYKLAGSDLSDSLDSGHIVRCVSAYSENLNHLLWSGDAVFLADLFNVY